ncbi:hypothetical protein GMLC_21120 [Geomonas limicola]|uniref:Uncharacterized protein n=1 Tax=Geomonas limicola TaxID=2740186 RepID=A0A6V8NAG5_9BACT|nr:hypothetical protein [Geomonas limicola]GFO68533.1 hypothetical protein GMLC_21120 [Geomonas limicola]
MKRHKDALGIQEGAINIRAMARSLVVAAEEAAGEGVGAEQDAAVRMIVHRLARVCRVDLVSYGYDPETLADTFQLLVQECTAKVQSGAGAIGSDQAPVMLEGGERRGSR